MTNDEKDILITQQRSLIQSAIYPMIQLNSTTLRDKFAMAALTGLLTGGFSRSAAAAIAYEIADAMMEARK